MIKNRCFVFTGLQPWDINIGSNAKDIAIEISKHNKVLYINTPLDIATILRNHQHPENIHRLNVLKRKEPTLRQVNPSLWVLDFPFPVLSTNFLPDNFLFDAANRLNNLLMHSFIKRYIKKLDFKDIILFTDNDIYRSLYAGEIIKPRTWLYYRRDYLLTDYWQKHAPRLEPVIAAKSSAVIANSNLLAYNMLPYNNNSFYVGQGVDLTSFTNAYNDTFKDYLSNIPHPRIGYIGFLTSLRLDSDLILAIAKEKPNYSIVLIGTEDEYFKSNPLHNLPNVYFIGHIPTSEVPYYIKELDICINPQKLNKMTEGNYPRKIDEYLAMGKPIVATKTDAMDIFKEYVDLCISTNDYILSIEKILNTELQSASQKIEFANSHSWANSVKAIYEVIKQVEKS